MAGSAAETAQAHNSSAVVDFYGETMQLNDGMTANAVGAVTNSVDALRFGLGLAEDIDRDRENPDPHYKNSFASAELARAIADNYDYASDEVRREASAVWEPALRAMDNLQELTRFGYSLERARELAMPEGEMEERSNPLAAESRARSDFREIFDPAAVNSTIALHDLALPPPTPATGYWLS